ncbi:MAG TPA: orotidine-5'-phosphate decarboxylase [bacterium]|nr:orotidine-5'-phosphate decarboxylase [bacterium]
MGQEKKNSPARGGEDIRERLILGLDIDDIAQAYGLIDKLAPYIKYYKVGLQLITKDGPRLAMTLKRKGLKIFYDAKFYDIPRTVYNASYEAARLGVNMFNVHASGGFDMIKAAREGAEAASLKLQIDRPLVLAVTVLTSMSNRDIKNIYKTTWDVKKLVLNFAKTAKKAGADGVVCSPKEVKVIRKELGGSFKIITPGIRLGRVAKDDQKRIMTPYDAIRAGSDYIVVARPILQADDKPGIVEKIMGQIREAAGK